MTTENLPTAYPLQWPTGRARAKSRAVARFTTNTRAGYTARRAHSVAESVDEISHALDLMGAEQLIVSTNIPLRADGWPRSGQAAPSDPGVAVYFRYHGKPVCLACDQWTKVEDNLWAVALTLEAMRGIDRWGAAELEATFTGYAALPAPAGRQWWDVLEVDQHTPSPDVIRASYRRLVKLHHPDAGGSADKFREVQEAYQAWEKTQR